MYDAEKQMLRELVWLLLGIGDGITSPDAPRCEFCGRHLIRAVQLNRTFGHRRHTSIPAKITIHHRDENRDNNAWNNLSIVHRACHKRHHNQKSAKSLPTETFPEVTPQQVNDIKAGCTCHLDTVEYCPVHHMRKAQHANPTR